MDDWIVTFPRTRVAAILHRGSLSPETETARELFACKREHGRTEQAVYRSDGFHQTTHDVDRGDQREVLSLR